MNFKELTPHQKLGIAQQFIARQNINDLDIEHEMYALALEYRNASVAQNIQVLQLEGQLIAKLENILRKRKDYATYEVPIGLSYETERLLLRTVSDLL